MFKCISVLYREPHFGSDSSDNKGPGAMAVWDGNFQLGDLVEAFYRMPPPEDHGREPGLPVFMWSQKPEDRRYMR